MIDNYGVKLRCVLEFVGSISRPAEEYKRRALSRWTLPTVLTFSSDRNDIDNWNAASDFDGPRDAATLSQQYSVLRY